MVTSTVEVMLARYAGYLDRERALAEATITRNVKLVRPFLAARLHEGHPAVEGLRASEVTAFVLEQSRQRRSGMPRLASALRSLLRFLHAEGLTESGLADAVPAAPRWRHSGLPQALRTGQGGCCIVRSWGRRDR